MKAVVVNVLTVPEKPVKLVAENTFPVYREVRFYDVPMRTVFKSNGDEHYKTGDRFAYKVVVAYGTISFSDGRSEPYHVEDIVRAQPTREVRFERNEVVYVSEKNFMKNIIKGKLTKGEEQWLKEHIQ